MIGEYVKNPTIKVVNNEVYRTTQIFDRKGGVMRPGCPDPFCDGNRLELLLPACTTSAVLRLYKQAWRSPLSLGAEAQRVALMNGRFALETSARDLDARGEADRAYRFGDSGQLSIERERERECVCGGMTGRQLIISHQN